jgi:ribosome-binding factor A
MGARVKAIVAELLERQVKDPRLGLVTVTDVRLTPDLREATVFWTVWGDAATRADSAAALESAKGVIRSAVGRATGLKHTPSIAFVMDAIPENAQQVEELLARAHEQDERVRRAAEGARPAGDPDPYRRPVDAEQ